MKSKRKTPELILRDGQPTAVILDIDEYQRLLEKLEDLEDLEALAAMRQKPLRFRKLEDFLAERESHTENRFSIEMNL